MSTETPRTDAYVAVVANGDTSHPLSASLVPKDFARQLERENAELRGKLERLAYEFQRHNYDLNPVTAARQLRAILNEGSK